MTGQHRSARQRIEAHDRELALFRHGCHV
jgi:hypothetical protein